MSSYVKKVHFKLHESYANPLRGKMSKDWKKNCCKRVPYYFYKQWNPTLRPLFCLPMSIHFLVNKPSLIRSPLIITAIFLGPLVKVIMGFHWLRLFKVLLMTNMSLFPPKKTMLISGWIISAPDWTVLSRIRWGEGSLCRAVTNTSSGRVYVISSRGIVQPGSNFGCIFLLFPKRVAGAHAHSSQGKSPAPPGSYSDSPAMWYQINRMGILWVRMCRILITFGPIW